MANTRDHIEDLARDLDMVVFRLERDLPGDAPVDLQRVLAERRRLRRELEGLRDRLEELARGL